MHKLFLAVAGVLAGIMAVAGSLYAHVIYEGGYTYASAYDCTWNRAEISHGSGGGYSKADVRSKQKAFLIDIDCFLPFTRPADHLKVRYKLYKQSGSSWNLCAHTAWNYNNTKADSMIIYTNHGTSPVCGNGSYKTVAYGYLKNGSQWKGGSISSGNVGHSLPTP